jgi:hypothetical protein
MIAITHHFRDFTIFHRHGNSASIVTIPRTGRFENFYRRHGSRHRPGYLLSAQTGLQKLTHRKRNSSG